ncbi:MAG: bifunctional folylpolyglutamate synthase/dihydrofolate synthase [Bacteroidales bacterium]|nr:bifunctional folylpolyglutamate synthase/dihydrofolate synthase [Bacteroidales bacterium]MBR6874681.1 bifunctional folylpolyglutamate synthase/dihydrofolate synthase [Bacteroidales bacterium]
MDYTTEQYNRLLEELYNRHPSVQNTGFTAGAYKPGLAGMERFDAALGHPARQFRSIHVAGTNGKGSVSSMLAAALSATGLRVGLYTSPHLVDFRERIKLVEPDGWSMIPREEVFRFLTENDLEGLSFFEITTGLAFWWFAAQQVDVAVIEVGLGGRLDSTNILTPELAVVTSIGLDHCALLGNTRGAVAAEKAGIFKPGVPALCGQRDDETAPVFEARASVVPCPLFFAEDFDVELFDTDLTGPCQGANLRTALAALELLGVPADREALSHTAARTGLRGRWERLCEHPEVICDIGHNPPALEINFRRLRESGRPLLIVFGIMADKDLDGIKPLMPRDAHYFLVAPQGSRALPADVLAARLEGLRCTVCGDVQAGVRQALEAARNTPGSLLYIGGSNFVVAEAVGLFDPN